MNDAGVLKNKNHYHEMGQLAIAVNASDEARQVVEKGIHDGLLKDADKTEQGRFDRLLTSAKNQSAADRATLAQLLKKSETATQGQADIAVGQIYLSSGKYDEAIKALQRGLTKGGIANADEAQISLGVAYLKKGQKDSARKAFREVGDKSRCLST